ncbi:FtsK/SpoIIIE domain-containing protein [Pseudarthrobacter sp. NamE5]|uniref:FtsK/SpoIIIE domain-containing protein n=1 Tax=Pseudarthrobacter sp. NamE5 TaxID=2576839 RepID=UPI00110B170C|nr:FtsK/SpoIIIE domain-containing protein [Pseudarthrobacter sp. NamE5]TLM86795.1 FHA domain-containing protein [Pseudarthrobacter sp. NamE5]
MTLHCTLVRGPQSPLAEPPVELSITAPSGTSGAQIHAELVRKFRTGEVFVNGSDLCSMALGTTPLVNGAVLIDGGAQRAIRKLQRRPSPESVAPVALAVHSGAGAGTLVPLRRGTYTIGRNNTRIVIPDPELSREHARLVVTDKDIMIVDLDSANGTYVDGGRVRHALITTASAIRCGNSSMSLVFLGSPSEALSDAGTSVHEPLAVAGPTAHSNRGVLLLTAVLPLVIGIGLAVITGMWMFLAFAAVSAVSVLIPLAAGRRAHREFRTRISTAVAEDAARRRTAGPSLAVLALAAAHGPAAAPAAPAEGRVWLRLGQASQPANVKVDGGSGPPALPSAREMPVLLDPAHPHTVIRGPRAATEGMARAFVMQFAAYPRGRSTRVVICGSPESLPLPARFLPGVTLAATRDACLGALREGLGHGCRHRVVLLTASPALDRYELLEAAAQLGWHVVQFDVPAHLPGAVDVELAEQQSVLREPGREIAFVPDLAPFDVFTSFCRQLAACPPLHDRAEPTIPALCRLDDVLPLSQAGTAARWTSSASTEDLSVPLGHGATGPQMLDLQSDGPHLLIAGTTGSGKSELLRSLTLALAVSYPPDRVNFLFVDFKGGSGLGPLAGLVHCVGVLTDLSAHELERTLASLRAEIRYREETLAAAGVPDLTTYRSSPASRDVALPHLVIVIDEFRMLVDNAPEALRELMRIASIGRSLGLHLVMATQRPQGALTADIRANVTTSIALRVQSDIESQDIIHTPAAAGISLDLPGRAFMARGMEPPQEFQTVSAGKSLAVSVPEGVEAKLTTDYLAAGGTDCPARAGSRDQTPAQAAAPLVEMVRQLWALQNGAMPRLPVAPPLPQQPVRRGATKLPAEARSVGSRDWTVELGLMDVPERQQVEPLVWDPAKDSHLALIGSPASGATEALELAAQALAAHTAECHFYLLDAAGSVPAVSVHSRTGAHVGLQELRRAVRVLERLNQELVSRLGRPGRAGVPLVLVISGWGSWVSAFRSGPLAWAEDLVQDLIRDGSRAGITVLLSGEREVVTARFSGSLPNRIFFPTGSNEDSRIAWPKMPSTAALRGRGVAFGSIAGGTAAVCQVYEAGQESLASNGIPPCGGEPCRTPPFRVEPLPALVSVPDLLIGPEDRDPRGTEADKENMLIGLGGDELDTVSVRVLAGGVFAVLGGASSGKTNVLHALRLLNPGADRWVWPEDGINPEDFWKQTLTRAKAGGLPKSAVLLADDADLLPAGALRDLAEVHAMGHAVVVTANYSPLLLQRVPLVMEARVSGTGMLLCPRSAMEGDLFGVRFDVEPNPPAGRGVLLARGRSLPIQVAWAGRSRLALPDGKGQSAGVVPPVREA